MDMIECVYTYSFIDVCIYNHLFTLPFQIPFFVNSSSSSCLAIVNVCHKRDFKVIKERILRFLPTRMLQKRDHKKKSSTEQLHYITNLFAFLRFF